MNTAAEFELKRTLKAIKANDENYAVRYGLVIKAMYLADAIGYKTGIKIDPIEPEWPVIYIDLPTGQISWHMPQYEGNWDGHTTDEKYKRINDYRKQ